MIANFFENDRRNDGSTLSKLSIFDDMVVEGFNMKFNQFLQGFLWIKK